MKNAFHWKGQPSIFTTGNEAADFNGVNTRRSELASDSAVANTITLPNSSIFNKPVTVGPQRRPPKTVKGRGRALPGLLAAVAVVVSTSVHAYFLDGNSLLERLSMPDPNVARAYVAGVFDSAAGVMQCAPVSVNLNQVSDMARQYLIMDPTNRNLPADILLMKMMSAAWPCPKKTGGPTL